MALSPSAPTTSPLPQQLLRYVSSQLVAAFNRPAPSISLPSAPRGVADAAAAVSQRLRAAASSPKGRTGEPPRQGSGGRVHATLAMATTARVVMREPAPPGLPVQVQQGSSGETHAAAPAAATSVVLGGPPPSGLPARGSGEKVDAALVAASLAVQQPTPPGPPREGHGGVHH